MVMPNTAPGAIPGADFPLGGGGDRNPQRGPLFILALMKAGRDGCTCASCRLLQQLIDEMTRDVEAGQHARASNNP